MLIWIFSEFMQWSWQQFIYTRCQNTNRKPPGSSSGGGGDASPRKRAKVLPPQSSYEVSYKQQVDLLKQEMGKTKPNGEIVLSLIAQTFPQRRKWILDAKPVGEIIQQFPFLRKTAYVSFLIPV